MLKTIVYCCVLWLLSMATASKTYNMSVCQDATYVVTGKTPCTGFGRKKPLGVGCPDQGDVAIANCHPGLVSYNKTTKQCVAPETATCALNEFGAWGCIFFSTLGCGELSIRGFVFNEVDEPWLMVPVPEEDRKPTPPPNATKKAPKPKNRMLQDHPKE